MIRAANPYRYALPPGVGLGHLEEALRAHAFVPCTASQDRSAGFVPPREEHGALVESVGGQWIARLMIETKPVPGHAVRRKADEAAAHIEATTGRKPGRKEMKALREDAYTALLATALPKQSAVTIWLDPEGRWLVTDSASSAKDDEVITALVRAVDGLSISPVTTMLSPTARMAAWLSAADAEEWPEGFAVERECELRSSDEEKAVVRYQRHHVFNDEVRRHVAEGKLPVRLALSWEGRVAFVLTEALQLRKVAFLDLAAAESRGAGDGAEDHFDADVAIMTGEMRRLLPELVEALGGEMQPGREGGAA